MNDDEKLGWLLVVSCVFWRWLKSSGLMSEKELEETLKEAVEEEWERRMGQTEWSGE